MKPPRSIPRCSFRYCRRFFESPCLSVRAPLTATDNLQAGRVDDQMEGAVSLPGETPYVDGPASPRKSGVVGHAQLEAHQADQGAHEALGLPKSQVEQRPERQRGLNRDIGVLPLPPGSPGRRGVPGADGVGVEPDRDVPPSAQRLLVRRPIPHPVLRLVLRSHLALRACGHLRRLPRLCLGEHGGAERAGRSRG